MRSTSQKTFGTSRKIANTRRPNTKQTDERKLGATTASNTPNVNTSQFRGHGTRLVNPEADYPISSRDHTPYARHSSDVATGTPAPHVTMSHSPARPECHARHLTRKTTLHLVLRRLLPCAATNTTSPTEHPNPHTVSTLAPHLTPQPDCVRRLGPTNTHPEKGTNTRKMVNIPRLGTRQENDRHPGRTYQPPQSYPLQIPAPHHGQIYITATTDSTPPSLSHLLPAPRHGLLSPAISIIPYITTKTLSAASNAKPKQSPDYFRNTIEVSV